jgi:sulfate/thiosulfate transport system permease protein
VIARDAVGARLVPVLRLSLKRPSVLPGFGLALGYTLLYLGLLVLIPLAGLVLKAASVTPAQFWTIATAPRTLAALKLSFGAAVVAAAINVVFGLLLAWVLVRYRFPLRGFINSLVDLPFALPTAVAGITLTAAYSKHGVFGGPLEALGIHVAYTPLGVIVALTFIGLPFVVRTVQPVLEDLEADEEEAAATLGATRWQTFRRVVFPYVTPALLTGFALAFARALGEYGSVVFISGNMPNQTEVVPLLIITRLQQFDYPGAAVIAVITLAGSFTVLLLVNLLERWIRIRRGASADA